MRRSYVMVGMLIAVIVVVAASFLASGDPDGLERVAAEEGFEDAGQAAPFEVIADYAVPGLDGPLATIAAGLIGIAVIFAVVWLLGRLLARRQPTAHPR